jgi:hypothetical protein
MYNSEERWQAVRCIVTWTGCATLHVIIKTKQELHDTTTEISLHVEQLQSHEHFITHFKDFIFKIVVGDSIVGIATRYELDGLGIEPR